MELTAQNNGISGERGDQRRNPQPETVWTPEYESWRHGGWYVTNVYWPEGGCGCVSNNYPDRKWRIVCEYSGTTFPSRDAAARAERVLTWNLANRPVTA